MSERIPVRFFYDLRKPKLGTQQNSISKHSCFLDIRLDIKPEVAPVELDQDEQMVSKKAC